MFSGDKLREIEENGKVVSPCYGEYGTIWTSNGRRRGW